MAGLVPAIHALLSVEKGVDARHKAGHDAETLAQANREKFYSPPIRRS
jgi:hypothetical protein